VLPNDLAAQGDDLLAGAVLALGDGEVAAGREIEDREHVRAEAFFIETSTTPPSSP